MPKTIGISPKLYVPVAAALTAVLTSWVATGEFDQGEVRGLIATAVLAAVSYIAPAGDVAVVSTEVPADGDDSIHAS